MSLQTPVQSEGVPMTDANIKHLRTSLTYAGVLPFIACALCLVMNVRTVPILGPVEQILGAYGLIIATFLAGSHWGQHLALCGGWGVFLPVSSNISALALWLVFLTMPPHLLFWALVASFGLFLFIDGRLYDADIIDHDYFDLRRHVTAIVGTTLIVAGFYA